MNDLREHIGSSAEVIAEWRRIDPALGNELLVSWGHKIGAIRRGNRPVRFHALLVAGKPVAVTATASLIRPTVAGVPELGRNNAIELARLCANGPQWCRVALRLWRETVVPSTGKQFGVSYADAALHRGEIYRTDGWQRRAFSHSGTDTRTGRRGRDKWVWVYPPLPSTN